MILQVDVGNTRLKWRCLSGQGLAGGSSLVDSVLAKGVLVRAEFSSAELLMDGLLLCLPVAEGAVENVFVASVAGDEFNKQFHAAVLARLGVAPQFACVTSEAAGVRVGYEDVNKLGVDRWLAVLAASRVTSAPCLVVDCGSAITVDVLQSGRHLGGYIVPGFGLMSRSLFANTSRVIVDDLAVAGLKPGVNTNQAVVRGLKLMVSGLVQEVAQQSQLSHWDLVVTGGDAQQLRDLVVCPGDIHWLEDLVLDGLGLADCRPLSGDASR